MDTTIALYKFKDRALKHALNSHKVKEIQSVKQNKYDIIVYKGAVCDSCNMACDHCYELVDFVDNQLTDEEKELYYFYKFCNDQKITPLSDTIEMKNEWLSDARVSSFKDLYAKYITVCGASVHCVDTDAIFDTNGYIYKKALPKVYDNQAWNDGDIVVVKQALKQGSNYGKFICMDRAVHDLENTIDTKERHINSEFSAIADYPIGHWASKFECDGQLYNIIDNNSLVLCRLSEASFVYVMEEREKIIKKVMNDEELLDNERLIIFCENDVMYGIISEFGLEKCDNINDHLEECNRILSSSCDSSFYMQFPRYKNTPRVSEKFNFMSKSNFVNNLLLSKSRLHSKLINELMQRGVSPNNFGLIDCGEL